MFSGMFKVAVSVVVAETKEAGSRRTPEQKPCAGAIALKCPESLPSRADRTNSTYRSAP
jgi:hypothetical protein